MCKASTAAAAKAAGAAAAAASRFTGRYAVHPLLPGTAQLIADSCKGRILPAWAPRAEELFNKWRKIAPCLPKYMEFQKKTNRKDLKKLHVFMNDPAQSKLAEFYLCCALQLRREAVDAAGNDSKRLLELAGSVATEEVEPFFEACREFVADYDEGLHKELDNTTVWREVDDGLFWHHSFEVTSPQEYVEYQSALLPPEAAWPDRDDLAGVEAVLSSCSEAVGEAGSGRSLAEDVYKKFLHASAAPIKSSIRGALIDHGIIWGEIGYRGIDNPSAQQGSE